MVAPPDRRRVVVVIDVEGHDGGSHCQIGGSQGQDVQVGPNSAEGGAGGKGEEHKGVGGHRGGGSAGQESRHCPAHVVLSSLAASLEEWRGRKSRSSALRKKAFVRPSPINPQNREIDQTSIFLKNKFVLFECFL